MTGRGIRAVGAIGTGLAMAASILGLVGYGGRWWWIADIVANFRPQLVLLGALGAILAAVGRRGDGVATGVVAIVLSGVLLVPYLPFGGRADTVEDATSLTVVTFNVRSANPRRADVIGWLRGVDADVVFLHESSTDWERDLLDADLPWTVTFPRRPGRVFGTAVLTRRAVPVTGLVLGSAGQVTVVVDLGDVTVLGTHPLSPTTARRAALRDEQLAAVRRWVIEHGRPTIVAGDLNGTAWSYAVRRLIVDAGLVDSMRGTGLEGTFPASWPAPIRLPIDHVLLPAGSRIVERELGPALGSDHLPVIVRADVPVEGRAP